MDRAELIIQLTGDREALTNLDRLKSAMRELHNTKAQLRIDKTDLDRQIARARSDLRALTDERRSIQLDGGDLEDIDARIAQLRSRLQELTDERRSIQLDVSDITNAESGLRDVQTEFRAADEAAVEFLNTLSSVFDGLSSLSSLTAGFATGIGDAFGAMSSVFDNNLFDYAQRKLTYMATEGVVGDLTKIVSRYDILSTFTQYMDAAGVSSEQAAESLQHVNDAILGLPIGLDEAAYRLRRYQMFLGDITDAENLTIGVQNALFAGGASEAMRTNALYQIDRLLSAGKLNTSRQWLALMQGLGVSARYVAMEMGEAGMSAGQMSAALSSGKIPASEFLRALMRLGEGSSEAAQELQGLLDVYKTTLESWLSNLQFAAVRGGETVLKAINQALIDTTDQGIVGYLSDLRDAMNAFYGGVGGFITGNPQLVSRNIDAVQGLLDALSKFSGTRLATAIFENLARGVDMISLAIDRLPEGEVEEFIAFATTLAAPLSRLFDIVSSGAPAVLAIFERFKDYDFEHLLDRIIEEVGRLTRIIESLLNLLGDDALTELITFGLVYGTPAAKAFGALAGGLRDVASALIVLSTIKDLKVLEKLAGMSTGLSDLFPILTKLSTAISAVFGSVGAFLGAGSILAGTFGALSIADNYRVEGVKEELGLSELRSLINESRRNPSAENARALQAWRDVLQGRVDALKGSDALEEIFAGTDKAREANDQLRAYERVLKDVDDALQATTAARQADNIVAEDGAELAAEVTEALGVEAEAAEETADSFSQLSQAYIAAGEAAGTMIGKQIDLFSELETAATQSIESLTEALETNIRGLTQYQENLEKAARFVASNPQYEWAQGLFSEVAGGGLESAGILQGLIDAMDSDLAALEAYGRQWSEAKAAEGGVIDWVAILTAGFSPEQIGVMIDEIFDVAERALSEKRIAAELTTDALRNEKFGKFTDNEGHFGSIGKEIGEAIGSGITEGIADTDTTEAAQQYVEKAKESATAAVRETDTGELSEALSDKTEEVITDAMGNAGFEDATDVLTDVLSDVVTDAADSADVDAAVDLLVQRLAESISNADASSIYDALSGLIGRGTGDGMLLSSMLPMAKSDDLSLTSGGTSIPELLRSFEGLSTAMQAFTEFGQPQMSESIELLQSSFFFLLEEGVQPFEDAGEWIWEVTVPGVIEALIGLISTLEDLIAAFVELTDVMDDAKDSADNLRSAVNSLGNMMLQKIPVVSQLSGTIDDLTSTVNSATSAVNALASAIAALESKHIDVSVGTSSAAYRANGGAVYLSGGGNPFVPRGTDTIPAMLSPGEFVMRRQAVQAFGVDFMRRINSLNVGGAIERLYRMFPNGGTFMPALTQVSNRNDNRNVSVNQNIYTNNPSYTYRRASRWAHAL